MTDTYRVTAEQSLFDIAVELTGNVEGFMALAIKNRLSPTELLTPGTELLAPGVVNEPTTVHYYRSDKKITPATAGTDVSRAENEGIGYWFVAVNFVIH